MIETAKKSYCQIQGEHRWPCQLRVDPKQSWPLSSCLATLSIRSIPTSCSEQFRAFLSLYENISLHLRHVWSSRLNNMKLFELLESSLRSSWSSFSAPSWLSEYSGYSGCRTSSCNRDCLGIVPANDGASAKTLSRVHLIHQKLV